MISIPTNILLFIKYAVSVVILFIIIMTPAWLARQTKKPKEDMCIIRIASWLFCWTGVAWLWALFRSIKN